MLMRKVSEGIAAEGLIAAIARKRNSHLPASHFADIPGGHCTGVCQRFIEMPGDPWQQIRRLRRDHRIVMIGGQTRCSHAGHINLIELALAEPDRIGDDWAITLARHGLNHQR